MKKIDLCGEWLLYGGEYNGIPAFVPGCVHTALRAGGYIPDMFYRDNNLSLQWIGESDWEYRRSFFCDRTEGASLLFMGLDTYADILLNGVLIGSVDDMFIPYRFDVEGVLRRGENLLSVRFRSPIREVEGCPERRGAFTTERINTRRIQCTYSWDWVDRFVTMGIHRPVLLEYDNGIDIEDVYIYTESVDAFSATMHLTLDFKNYKPGAVAEARIIDPDGNEVGRTELYADRRRYVRRIDIKQPQLWYPNGYGAQPLYTLIVRVGENEKNVSFGIRTVKLLQLVDEVGSEYHNIAEKMQKTPHGAMFSHNERHSGFQVLVNGEPILCRGGNWVPCEPFPSDESDEKIVSLVMMARDMGANFLRVWGGGVFEKEAFYSACDRAGILVAQDFLMACGTYPEKEEWFIDRLRLEAEYATRALRNHACLAWWHGDNENATEGSDTMEDYIGRDSALSGIADIIYENDPSRVFLPSSPYGGNTYGSVTVGTTHTTNFLGQIFEYFDTAPCLDYKEYLGGFNARFISEEGTFGAVNPSSMLRFMTEEDLADPEEYILAYHTKGNPALEKEIFDYVTAFARKALGEPCDTEERLFKYRYIQYEWIRVASEALRRNIGYCNGLVFWMFNDCWPAALGWALVDYYLYPKAGYYAFRRLAGEVGVSVRPENGKMVAYVSSDKQLEGEFFLTARVIDEEGRVVAVEEHSGELVGYGVSEVILEFAPKDTETVLVDVKSRYGTDRSFWREGGLPLSKTDLFRVRREWDSFDRESGERLHYITVEACGYIHCLELLGDYIFEDNYMILTEGEIVTVKGKPIGEGGRVTVNAFTIAPVSN